MTIDHEKLVAYADGELGADERKAVEAELTQDPDAVALLAELKAQRAVLRAAFIRDMEEPLPGRTLDLFRERGGAAAPVWWRSALAAGLASVIFGGLAAFGVAELRTDQVIARYEAERARDQARLASLVQEALEEKPSGDVLVWSDPDDGSRMKITPLRTFKNAGGDWCREYLAEAAIGQQLQSQRAIACRVQDGQWLTRVQAPTGSQV